MKNIDAVFEDTTIISSVIPALGSIREAREKFKNGDFLIDMRASFQINNISRIGIIINNVTNTEYMTRPANMMSPRTLAIQWNMKI